MILLCFANFGMFIIVLIIFARHGPAAENVEKDEHVLTIS